MPALPTASPTRQSSTSPRLGKIENIQTMGTLSQQKAGEAGHRTRRRSSGRKRVTASDLLKLTDHSTGVSPARGNPPMRLRPPVV
jgi:hypothetical protein